MKNQIFEKLIRTKKIAVGFTALALALIIGSVSFVSYKTTVPEFPVYTDPVLEISIEDEETPLASKPKVSSKTTKKTTKKNVKMKAAAAKSYTKKLPSTKKTTTKKKSSGNSQVSTKKIVLTDTTEKYTRNSKVKTVITTVTTTVETTTNDLSVGISVENSRKNTGKYEASMNQIASLMDERVLAAYEKMGFKVTVDPSVSYAGYFNAKDRMITLQMQDDTIYHELGHFLAFITGNTDKSAGFVSVFQQEKDKYQNINKAYATQNSSEYFAESVKDYCVNPQALKSSRPKTYTAISEALAKVTEAQVNKVMTVYAPFWK